ncbi:MAG: GTPase Era [candidate division KSB1 bacterium]|nr:GTPase Era [candidate division KSB1 bacterium]
MSQYRAGYVAVIGRPNVGKSTLVNRILKFPLSITTAKPQTTRHRILGIYNEENLQIIFLDTPGLIDPKYRMQEMMMKAARGAVQDADVVLFLVQAGDKISKRDAETAELFKNINKPCILVINKADLLHDKNRMLPLMEQYQSMNLFEQIIPISALNGDNVDDIKEAVRQYLPYSPPFYPDDMISEHPERFFVSELIREQVFQYYRDEVPFSTAVVIDEFREQSDRKDYIKARIVVERQSQKKIIIGKNGKAIREMGKRARKSIEEFLERPVFLECWVSVREKWRKKDVFLKEFGLDRN